MDGNWFFLSDREADIYDMLTTLIRNKLRAYYVHYLFHLYLHCTSFFIIATIFYSRDFKSNYECEQL